MNDHLLATLGVLAGLLNLVSAVPYFIDIARGKTKPERATWWIWLILNSVSLAAQLGAHARWSVLMTVGQVLVTAAIAVLSVRFGYGTFHRKDFAAIGFAIAGVGLWWWLDSPLAALLVVLAVDAVGFWLTLEKTWRAPHTETLLTWMIATLSGALGVLAVGSWDFTKAIYPFYIMIGNGLMTAIIVYRRPRLENVKN